MTTERQTCRSIKAHWRANHSLLTRVVHALGHALGRYGTGTGEGYRFGDGGVLVVYRCRCGRVVDVKIIKGRPV